jgi:hypothetical protein
MSNQVVSKYATSEFKKLIEILINGIQQPQTDFSSSVFEQLYNELGDKQKFIEDKSRELVAIDDTLKSTLKNKQLQQNLFVFQLQVLRDYLNDVKIEESNININLRLMTQKFSSLVDISTKGLLPSGFNSDPPNNLARLEASLAPQMPLIDKYLSDMWRATIAQRTQLNAGVRGAQGGGSLNTYMGTINKLSDIYSIFNSDILLKAMSLISSSKSTADEMGVEMFNIMKQLFTLLFITINDYPLITKEVQSNDKTLQDKIERDTSIYNNNSSKFGLQQGNNIILIKTFFEALKLEDDNILQTYLANSDNSKEFLKLLTHFIAQIDPLSSIYKFFYKNYVKLNQFYDKNVKENKKVSAYIKERNDLGERNKRFTIEETDKFLSLKYVPVHTKVANSDINTNENQEYYYFGPYTDTFLGNKSNQDIANSISNSPTDSILTKLIDNAENVFVLGYGQSGSGKTSTLIKLDDPQLRLSEPGIIPYILMQQKFIDSIGSINMQIIELIGLREQDNKYIKLDLIGDMITDSYILPEDQTKTIKYAFTYNNKEWVMSNGTSIQKYMMYCVNNRNTEPTSNNPDSSRSHIIISLECKHKQKAAQQGGQPVVSYLICGDLAGVENKFVCNDPLIIKGMLYNYMQSKKNKTLLNSSGKQISYKDKRLAFVPGSPSYDEAIADSSEVTDGKNDNPLLKALKQIKTYYDKLKSGSPSNEDVALLAHYARAEFTLPVTEATTRYGAQKSELEIRQEEQQNKTDLQMLNTRTGETLSQLTKKIQIPEIPPEIITQVNEKLPTLNLLQNKMITLIGSGGYTKGANAILTATSVATNAINTILSKLDTELTKEIIEAGKPSEESIRRDLLKDQKILIRNIIDECATRTSEGYFINTSLKQMREDIKSILISNFNNNTLYFDKSIFPYCINTTVKQSKLDRFYTKAGEAKINGTIMKIVNQIIGSKLNKLNFIIFTIIKTDIGKNQIYNNPPTVPYINTNDLYYNTYINSNYEKLRETINTIKAKAEASGSFYARGSTNEIKLPQQMPSTFPKLQEVAKDILEKIDTNNDSTLIGSLISTEKLNNLIFDKMICSYNKDFNNNLTIFNQEYFPISSTPTNNIFNPVEPPIDKIDKYNQMLTRKYMKYKSKYLMKLKSRALKK